MVSEARSWEQGPRSGRRDSAALIRVKGSASRGEGSGVEHDHEHEQEHEQEHEGEES
jgi:hypothetical protein